MVLLPDVFESTAVQAAVAVPLQGGVTQPAAGNSSSNRQRWFSTEPWDESNHEVTC